MRSLNLLLSLSLAGPLAAQDFAPLVQATRTVYPAKHHVGVVCDYGWSRSAVEALAGALGPEDRITVVDIRAAEHTARAQHVLRNVGAEVLVLMPMDRYVRDGSPYASFLARGVADAMPTLGTTRAALKNGAAFAIGADTGLELLVNTQLRGVIGPFQGGSPAGARSGRTAQIRVIGF